MITNRPRESILDLFDPLNSGSIAEAPSTPTRDIPSPDSDKENAAPSNLNIGSGMKDGELTMSTFFGRTYKRMPEVTVPKKRLVDVGDTTIDLDSEALGSSCGERSPIIEVVEGGENNHVARTPVGSPTQRSVQSPRTPFADLPLRPEALPIVRKKTYGDLSLRAPPGPSALSVEVPFSVPDTEAKFDTALTSIIRTVNTSGVSFAESDVLRDSSEERLESRSSPEIVVSPPDDLASSLSELRLTSSTADCLSDATIPLPPPSLPSFARPRPNPPSTSSLDPRRSSVDLYTSFNLHLQCPDTSFDLLNDRISFFGGNGGIADLDFDSVSFAAIDTNIDGGEDESFDMKVEEERMEQVLKRMKAEEKKANLAYPSTRKDTLNKPASGSATPEVRPKFTSSSADSTPKGVAPTSDETVRKPFQLNTGAESPTSPTIVLGQLSKRNESNRHGPPVRNIFDTEGLAVLSAHDDVFEPASGVQPQSTLCQSVASSIVTPSVEASALCDPVMRVGPIFSLPLPVRPSSPHTPPPVAVAHIPVVPALRIIKRTKGFGFGHENMGSGSSTAEVSQPTTAPAASSIVLPTSKTKKPASNALKPAPKSSLGPIARLGRMVTPASVSSVYGKSGGVDIVSRVPTADGQEKRKGNTVGVPTSVDSSITARSTAVAGVSARRVPAPAVGVLPRPGDKAGEIKEGKAGISGLRQPVKYGSGVGSALPRPHITTRPVASSRVPAPSVGGRTKASGGVTAIVKPGDIPARRVIYGS